MSVTAMAAKWIDAELLARFPDGPYAVYAYYPQTCREYVTRNQSAESAATQADILAGGGLATRVHVSLDTCG